LIIIQQGKETILQNKNSMSQKRMQVLEATGREEGREGEQEGDREVQRDRASNFKHFWDHEGNFNTINEEPLVLVVGKQKCLPVTSFQSQ
jgi:hypothetical protein